MNTAKIFWSGRSQAVRLPKDFRFNDAAVYIRRQGNAIVLEPIPHNWTWLDTICGKLDEDFISAAREHPKNQDRPKLDELFK